MIQSMNVAHVIPSVEVFLALEPEQLGAKLLFLIKERLWEAETRREPTYPRQHRSAIALAFTEGWSWLEAQSLIVPAPQENGRNGYRVLSRRAKRFESEAEVVQHGHRTPKSPDILPDNDSRSFAEPKPSRKIFVVHGHDEGAREAVARFLERLNFDPIILHEQANQGRTVIEKVEAHSDVGFAVVLLPPDDQGCAKGGIPQARARQNVLLELGYFVGPPWSESCLRPPSWPTLKSLQISEVSFTRDTTTPADGNRQSGGNLKRLASSSTGA